MITDQKEHYSETSSRNGVLLYETCSVESDVNPPKKYVLSEKDFCPQSHTRCRVFSRESIHCMTFFCVDFLCRAFLYFT